MQALIDIVVRSRGSGHLSAVRHIAVALVWLLPPCVAKNRMLNLLGNRIDLSAVLWPSVVLSCGVFELAEGVVIMPGNIFRRLSRVEIGNASYIGRFNQITAAPEFQEFDRRAGVLKLGEWCGMTNRHYLDCTGRIELRDRSGIGGSRSIFESHTLDIETNRPSIASVVIGEYSMTGSSCVVLQGARVPERSVIGMGSVMVAPPEGTTPPSGLYVGAPARWRGELPDCAWWHRDEPHTMPLTMDDFDADFDIPWDRTED